MTKSLTISHDVTGNFGACKVIMRPSIEGSGVIAGGAVRTVLEVAGIKNVIAKQLGSNNLLNNLIYDFHPNLSFEQHLQLYLLVYGPEYHFRG